MMLPWMWKRIPGWWGPGQEGGVEGGVRGHIGQQIKLWGSWGPGMRMMVDWGEDHPRHVGLHLLLHADVHLHVVDRLHGCPVRRCSVREEPLGRVRLRQAAGVVLVFGRDRDGRAGPEADHLLVHHERLRRRLQAVVHGLGAALPGGPGPAHVHLVREAFRVLAMRSPQGCPEAGREAKHTGAWLVTCSLKTTSTAASSRHRLRSGSQLAAQGSIYTKKRESSEIAWI